MARSHSRGLAAAALLLAAAAVHAQPQPLTVCMAEDNAPLSYKVGDKGNTTLRGLDVRIAQAVAQELGRPLKLLPFESEYEKESTLAQEVGALLAAGLCEAASGFALQAGDLGPPQRPNARPPDYPGAPRKRDRPFVKLQPLAPSRGYMAVALGLVQRPGTTPAAGLAELQGQRLGVAAGTLAGTVAMGWRGGLLHKSVVSLGQREDPLAALNQQRVDVLLLPLAHIDGLRRQQPDLVVPAWRKPIGLNLGFVTLESNAAVLAAIERVLERHLATGTLARWAAEEGVSYTPPQLPDVRPGIALRALMAD